MVDTMKSDGVPLQNTNFTNGASNGSGKVQL